MKVADYIARRLSAWGLDTCFAVTGGGAMHLNDAFGAVGGWDVRYLHHEQACSMAAEGYARLAGKPAVLNVTSGPGSINALNGVFGAFTDSVPMVIVAGQARRDTNGRTASIPGLRQLGDQEARMLDMVAPITVWRGAVDDPTTVQTLVDDAVRAATTGRPGPVWLEVPVDVQGQDVDGLDPADSRTLASTTRPAPDPSAAGATRVLSMIQSAQRPLLLAGSGLRTSGTADLLPKLARSLNIPVSTAWTHDTISSDDDHYAGRPGTIGTRAGNFVLQACDLLLVLGSRLNIRQTSYNWAEFAPHATVVWVDIDPAEMLKPFVRPDVAIIADLADFVPELLALAEPVPMPPRESWWAWVRDVRQRYEPALEDYVSRDQWINPYHLVLELSRLLSGSHVVACGDATACIVPFQVLAVREGMRLFSNSGCASMGYDLPAALGASVAVPERPVIALAGDGSVMMNLQELQTMATWRPDLLLLILDNGGYLSIKQTQSNFFGREFGASPSSGISFPDFGRVAESFGLPVTHLQLDSPWRGALEDVVRGAGPRVCVAHLDQAQEFEPRLRSRMIDGVIRTPPLDDMYPHLDDEELKRIRRSAAEI